MAKFNVTAVVVPKSKAHVSAAEEKERIRKLYLNPVQLWDVSTDSDCSVHNLGVYYGHVADIAFKLAPLCRYSLCFKVANEEIGNENYKFEDIVATYREVEVCFGIESRTWDLTSEQRVAYFKEVLDISGIEIRPGRYHAAVLLRIP